MVPLPDKGRPVVAVVGILAALVALVASFVGGEEEVQWLWVAMAVLMLVVGSVILYRRFNGRRRNR